MKTRRVVLILMASSALGACVLGEVGQVMHPTIGGHLEVRGADGHETTWIPDHCISGDLAYFAGFDFVSADGAGLRAVVDPIDGPRVRWTPGGAAAAIVLHSADCAVLDVAVQPTGWEVNDVRELGGHVELRCDAPGGTHLQGRLTVDHCH